MIRCLYSALMVALTPIFLLRLLRRSQRSPDYRKRWNERFGYYPGTPKTGGIWFHAVSVGEAEAAFPLIQATMQAYPDTPILVTSTTPTGSARVKVFLGDAVQNGYLPYDTPGAVRRFFRHFQPALGVIMETEIWPNLLRGANNNGVPVVLVNARLSARSAAGYAKLSSLTRQALADFSYICAQGQATADRFMELGADPERVAVSGNIKFDMNLPDTLLTEAGVIRRDWFGNRPVVIAASTHEGEDEEVLQAFRQLKIKSPESLLLLVPRHPERAESVMTLCVEQGWSVVRRSSETTDCRHEDIFLLDTIGELRLFYAVADVAYVGGSLVPTGGHNMLEPAALAKPVLFGPHVFNFPEISELLLEAGAARQVTDAQALGDSLIEWIEQPELAAEVGSKGLSFVAQNRGALGRVLEVFNRYLPRALAKR